ncbi:MAG: 6-bladed beta-propeller, partial [Odoribacter sp.]|nr:6-bladed beta-propeller [Odoribacter sp.]
NIEEVKYVMKVNNVFLFSILLLLFSCRQGGNSQENLTVFSIEDFEGKELKVDEHFSHVKLLPLQLDTNRIIGQVKDVCVIGDTIFLLDGMASTLYSFDKNGGKYLASASKKGHGPNEYINPVALSVDAGNLYVLDMSASRIIKFDKDLNAVESIRFDFPASDFIALDSGFLLYNLTPTSGKGKFVHINGKGEYVNSFVFPKEKEKFNNILGGGKTFFENEESDVFVFEPYGEIVYKWYNDTLQPLYRMDFGKLGIPSGIDRYSINLYEEPYVFCGNIFMLSDMFIPSYFYKSQRYYGFIPLSEGESMFGIVKDKCYNIPFFPQWQHGNELIGVCSRELAGAQDQLALVFYVR